MLRRCLEKVLELAARVGKNRKCREDICVGVSIASFHLFLPLISVTSCLQRKWEKVRKVKRRNERPSREGTEKDEREGSK